MHRARLWSLAALLVSCAGDDPTPPDDHPGTAGTSGSHGGAADCLACTPTAGGVGVINIRGCPAAPFVACGPVNCVPAGNTCPAGKGGTGGTGGAGGKAGQAGQAGGGGAATCTLTACSPACCAMHGVSVVVDEGQACKTPINPDPGLVGACFPDPGGDACTDVDGGQCYARVEGTKTTVVWSTKTYPNLTASNVGWTTCDAAAASAVGLPDCP